MLFTLYSPFFVDKPASSGLEESTDNPTGSLTKTSTNENDRILPALIPSSIPAETTADSAKTPPGAIYPEATAIDQVGTRVSPLKRHTMPPVSDSSNYATTIPSGVPETKKVAAGKGAASKQPSLPEATTPLTVSRSTGGSGVSIKPELLPKSFLGKKGTGLIVIDDAGNNLKELDPFLSFPGALTIAVLPGLPHSAEAARRIRAAGKDVILHQPMEAIGGQNPGPGAIFVNMSPEEMRVVLERNIAEVGPIVGMNNHQGSLVTSDVTAMETILAVCRKHDIYFLDSRTTGETVVPAVAARMGIRIRERDVFVDNIQERAEMIRFIQEGFQKAEKKGSSVMIGHAWSSELASTLRELYPELIEQGFSLSTISRIMMGTYDDEGFGD